MKACRYLLISTLLLAVACKQKNADGTAQTDISVPDTTEVKAIPPEQLITPGKSIGHLSLESSMEQAIQLLGRADSSDAAMGSAMATWFADHKPDGYRTSIFAHRNMGGKDEAIQHIKKILVTSPWFKTAEYISTGNTLRDIQKYYTLKKGTTYNDNGRSVQTYTDLGKGISFEIAPTGECVGILVHAPNTPADAYINMH